MGLSQRLVGLGSVVTKMKITWSTRLSSEWDKIKAEKEKYKELQEELETEQKKCFDYQNKCKKLEENMKSLKEELSECTVTTDDATKLQEDNFNLKNTCTQYEVNQQKLQSKLILIEQKVKEMSVKMKEVKSQRERFKVSYMQNFGVTINHMKGLISQLLKLIKKTEESKFINDIIRELSGCRRHKKRL